MFHAPFSRPFALSDRCREKSAPQKGHGCVRKQLPDRSYPAASDTGGYFRRLLEALVPLRRFEPIDDFDEPTRCGRALRRARRLEECSVSLGTVSWRPVSAAEVFEPPFPFCPVPFFPILGVP